MRRRDAPSDSRTPISRWRVTPRASSRFATLAQPIIRTSPNAKKIGVNTRSTSPASAIGVPLHGRSRTTAARPSAFGWRDAHTPSAASAADFDTPGRRRPTSVSIGTSSTRPAYAGRNSATRPKGAQ
jgi:hypothetical protein